MISLSSSKTMEETNAILSAAGLPTYDHSFSISFRDRKKVFFEVCFGDVKVHTQRPRFVTSASQFNHTRTDFNQCGQCQKDLIKRKSLNDFFEKWDKKHLKCIDMEEYKELIKDIDSLKNKVPYIESTNFYDLQKFDRSFK